MTSLSIGMKCIKYIIFITNIVFFGLGVLLIGLGGYSVVSGSVADIISNSGATLGIGIIILGIFIMGLSFFGCCGARKENRPLLGIYFGVLLVIAIVQFSIAIASVVYSEKIPGLVEYGWNNYSTDDQKRTIERYYECCGFISPNDTPNCADPSWTKTCKDAIVDDLQTKAKVLQGASLAIVIAEIFGLVCACCLFVAITRSKRRGERLRDEP
eukprot:TRINITY_DN316_c0_g1_i2.p1 TRINITY_DN316_c0_g1~~TRINITY_DN316_c0_g1_i2.p1  ORF type:complete len:213 (-),score=63.51 TRINITY_DN316_c0_g1_i2:149-787(-)